MRTLRILGVYFVPSLVVAIVGCGGDESITIKPPGSTSSSGGSGGDGGNGGTAGGGGMAQGGAAGSGQGGGMVGECSTAADCDKAFGAAPCGNWACNAKNGACEAQSPGCVDADQDGFGFGAGCACAGLDCDDNDDNVADNAVMTCYSGPANTAGVGTCQAGTRICTAGVVGSCTGEVTPSGEACNLEDDNCDGQVDENLGNFNCGIGACATTVNACQNGAVGLCAPPAGAASDGPACNGVDDDCDGAIDEDCKSCVAVAPTGNDTLADGSFMLPFATIQAAINWAATHVGPKTVCVASGAACGSSGNYANAAGTTVTMANGVSVLGNYESVTWNRCTNSTTFIRPQTGAGVTFPVAVQSTTVLDGFRIERFQGVTTAGVTVDGGKGAILSNITIQNAVNVSNSYGVHVINGGDLTITKSRIDAGTGTAESIGVRSVGSRVTIQDNCLSPNAQGRCDDPCNGNPSIRGRTQSGTGITYAVLLQDSPGSLIQSSAMCANDADQGAVMRIVGSGKNITIRGNYINAFGGAQDSHGIWMEDCGGEAPWIVNNQLIAAAGDTQQTRTDGVRAIGDCHPVVDSNVRIAGGGEGQASNPNGVHCAANAAGLPSKCVVLGNQVIQGSQFGFPPISTGVRCDDGGCNRIEKNVITGRGGQTAYGVFLQNTGTFVDANEIRGGCSPVATGVQAENAYARLQNNAIFGRINSDCTGAMNPAPTSSVGLRVLVSAGVNEIDVHSNNIDGAATTAACNSRAIEFGVVGSAPMTGMGVFRNNILRAGSCMTSKIGFAELLTTAEPRLFQNNLFDIAGSPTALYLDEGTQALLMASQVDALVGTTASGTLSADPQFVAYPTDVHLMSGSPCINGGATAGAPTADYYGKMRDATPDVGAAEF
jgi:hypothetical protein